MTCAFVQIVLGENLYFLVPPMTPLILDQATAIPKSLWWLESIKIRNKQNPVY